MKISVMGLGKAGLPLAAVIADAGIDIIGLDVDRNKIATLEKKENPIPEEPGLKEIIQNRIGNNFNVTSNPEKAITQSNVHIIIVPLFIDENKQSDFTILDKAFTTVGKYMKKGDLVVLETTVPAGTTENRIKNILEKESRLKCK